MKAIDIIIKDQAYRIIRNNADNCYFSVFNHTTCHIIAKNDFGIWKRVQHIFGVEIIPIEEIGGVIDSEYTPWPEDETVEAGTPEVS